MNNALVVDDDFVSADHAALTFRGRVWFLEDRGSTNGRARDPPEPDPAAEGEHGVVGRHELVIDHEAVVHVAAEGGDRVERHRGAGRRLALGEATTTRRPSGLLTLRTAARMSRHSNLTTTKKNT